MCDNRKDLIIKGYEHPDTYNTSKSSQYKLYTKRGKKNEMSDFSSIDTGNPYATVSFDDETTVNNCPVCTEIPEKLCYCSYNDKQCKNKHIWFTDRKGAVIVGNPHK